MYAAAGGASIASRKARQNKAQGKVVPKKPPPKVVKQPVKVEKPQSKQFHHLPDNYHKHADNGQSLVPPAAPGSSLQHSRSLTLRAGEGDPLGLRGSRSAHELPLDSSQALEPGVVGHHSGHGHEPEHVGSPPRAYSCPHWEARLLRAPGDKMASFGSADVPYAACECAQGKAAWQEAAGTAGAAGGRRCSVAAEPGAPTHRTKQTEAHLRWMKKNKIHDLSYGGSSSDEEELERARARAAGAAGGVLYVGLGIVALGLVISFVGTGDKGFKTYELRLAGPALIAAGLACCVLRILLCACPARCRPPRARARPKEPAAERLLLSERGPPLVLHSERERDRDRDRDRDPRLAQPVSLGPRSPATPATPATPPASPLRRFPEPITVEPRSPSPPVLPEPPPPAVPLVLLSQPDRRDDSLVELQTVDGSSFDISSISSSEMSVDNMTVIENASPEGAEGAEGAEAARERSGKLSRVREPLFARRQSGPPGSRTVTFADTPNIIAPPSEAPPPPAEIVLTPSKLGQ